MPPKVLSEECILCSRRSGVFGVGECRHPACMECVIRMRCMVGSNNCHFCRDKIEIMYFIVKPPNWNKCRLPKNSVDHPDCDKFGICFESEHVVETYDKYNAFECKTCQQHGEFAEFGEFAALKQHMSQRHDRFFCHICLDNLVILPKHQRSYSQKELEFHMSGEKNVVPGVSGHPKCKFCNERFFDDDKLYKHLRKQHFYCGLCALEGNGHVVFKIKEDLQKHFEIRHYPCFDLKCVGVVFGSELELDLHKSEHHAEVNRPIPVNFPSTRSQVQREKPVLRATQNQVNSHTPSTQGQFQREAPVLRATHDPINLAASSVPRPLVIRAPPKLVRREQDFPSLSASFNVSNSHIPEGVWNKKPVVLTKQGQPVAPKVQPTITPSIQFPKLSASIAAKQNNAWTAGNFKEMLKKLPIVRETLPTSSKKTTGLTGDFPSLDTKPKQQISSGKPEVKKTTLAKKELSESYQLQKRLIERMKKL